MIDFHTHILPGIDDGSIDMDMTEKMLCMERDQGVSHIYATPHFYAHRRSVDRFLERRAGALSRVKTLLHERQDLPQITAGAEVYYFSGIGRAEQLSELCIEGTDILLLEMPFSQWHRDMLRDVKDILDKRHLRIVLAHVERYEHLQKDSYVWNEIMEMPLTIQMNADSFITSLTSGRHARRAAKFCMRTLEEKNNCIIGTDCHNLTDRAPNLAGARRAIEKKLGAERLTQLDIYTESLLRI